MWAGVDTAVYGNRVVHDSSRNAEGCTKRRYLVSVHWKENNAREHCCSALCVLHAFELGISRGDTHGYKMRRLGGYRVPEWLDGVIKLDIMTQHVTPPAREARCQFHHLMEMPT